MSITSEVQIQMKTKVPNSSSLKDNAWGQTDSNKSNKWKTLIICEENSLHLRMSIGFHTVRIWLKFKKNLTWISNSF